MTADSVIDLDFYCWRERVNRKVIDVSDGNTVECGERLLIPHCDPWDPEDPVDYVFDTAQEAIDARDEHFPDETGWVLIHYVGTIMEA